MTRLCGANLAQNIAKFAAALILPDFRIDGGGRFVVSWWRSPGLNSVATEVRTGAVDEPLG